MPGQKINDHSFWGGARSKDSVFPHGPHKTKPEHTVEGAGAITMDYPDTTENIKRDQEKAHSQTKKHPMKPGYRY
jgi:hypothetical protein